MKLRGLTMRVYMIVGWLLTLTVSACGSVTGRAPSVDASTDSSSDVRKSGEAGSGGGQGRLAPEELLMLRLRAVAEPGSVARSVREGAERWREQEGPLERRALAAAPARAA